MLKIQLYIIGINYISAYNAALISIRIFIFKWAIPPFWTLLYVQLPVNLSKQGCSTADLNHARGIFLLLSLNSLPFIFCLKWHTHSRQQGRSETEEYSSDSESESEDEEELQMILEDLQNRMKSWRWEGRTWRFVQSLISPTLYSYCC